MDMSDPEESSCMHAVTTKSNMDTDFKYWKHTAK